MKFIIIMIIMSNFVIADTCRSDTEQIYDAFADVRICSEHGTDSSGFYVKYRCERPGNKLFLLTDDCDINGCYGGEYEGRSAKVYLTAGVNDHFATCWSHGGGVYDEVYAKATIYWDNLDFPYCGDGKCTIPEKCDECPSDCGWCSIYNDSDDCQEKIIVEKNCYPNDCNGIEIDTDIYGCTIWEGIVNEKVPNCKSSSVYQCGFTEHREETKEYCGQIFKCHWYNENCVQNDIFVDCQKECGGVIEGSVKHRKQYCKEGDMEDNYTDAYTFLEKIYIFFKLIILEVIYFFK